MTTGRRFSSEVLQQNIVEKDTSLLDFIALMVFFSH
jgi:hypothetical protein